MHEIGILHGEISPKPSEHERAHRSGAWGIISCWIIGEVPMLLEFFFGVNYPCPSLDSGRH